VALFAALLSLPPPAQYPPLTLTPQRQKQKTLEALLAWLVQEAGRQPVLVVVEDVHWVDPSTLEFLSLLLDHVPTTRLLLLLTFRPDFTPPWAMFSHLTHLTLSRLARQQIEVMVEKVTGGKPLPAEVIQQLITKTDGVPLFVEELTKTVLESIESSGSSESAIPTTLQDSLMARLDRLGPAKELAQLGATLGREFSHELIQAVASLSETALHTALDKLVDAEILYQRGSGEHARYLFKHALIQDTAYQSLLKSTRQHLHRQIAQVLEQRFKETVETQPELLAHHYTEAGLTAQAIPYWQQAGQKAVQRSANPEAISHFTTALELLKSLPDTLDRAQQELLLHVTLGVPLQAIRGVASPEVISVYTRARELCQQVGETQQLFPVLFGLRMFHQIRGEFLVARELGQQLLGLAQREQDPALLMEAHRAVGGALFHLGEFGAAQAHLAQSLNLYDAQRHRSHMFLYTTEPGVFGPSYAALVLWHLGYPDQALQKSKAARTLAQELSHSYTLAGARCFAAKLHQLLRERALTQEWAETGITLAREQGFPNWVGQGTVLQGWARAGQGQVEEGITQIRQGLTIEQAIGTGIFQSYYLVLLAEAYGKAGQVEEGLSVVAEALTVVDKSGERFYEAELYRLKGTLVLQSGVRGPASENPNTQHPTPSTHAEAEAEECFWKAIEIAQRQQAKSLELRAVMSLARLWQSQGKKEEARQLLAEIYDWFTEGFDTKDSQEAKALIEAL